MQANETRRALYLGPRHRRRSYSVHWLTANSSPLLPSTWHSTPSPISSHLPPPTPAFMILLFLNAKLVADLIASLYKQERFHEAKNLFSEAVLKLRFKERNLCMFYCNLVASHANHEAIKRFLDLCAELSQLMFRSSYVYIKRRGYESMIVGFCEMGFLDRADNLIQEMREMGLKPSGFEFRSLVYGYGQMGSLEGYEAMCGSNGE